ncbi:hypothetical protein EW145_g8194 [Phellinidium pouzarii]|uniref:Uncharacterized protein n=1 Tax=Phellinidium pouzarii TaxID=167371 RepID=A0A4S4K8F3_9AGAM|nr:hypothetical protein EW145_g8194 [Phellinidium pouzarii]
MGGPSSVDEKPSLALSGSLSELAAPVPTCAGRPMTKVVPDPDVDDDDDDAEADADASASAGAGVGRSVFTLKLIVDSNPTVPSSYILRAASYASFSRSACARKGCEIDRERQVP